MFPEQYQFLASPVGGNCEDSVPEDPCELEPPPADSVPEDPCELESPADPDSNAPDGNFKAKLSGISFKAIMTSILVSPRSCTLCPSNINHENPKEIHGETASEDLSHSRTTLKPEMTQTKKPTEAVDTRAKIKARIKAEINEMIDNEIRISAEKIKRISVTFRIWNN
ncbi:hypothetical protein OUZ56_031110 [Daphnia magna]|uniref:Uncharacterized protein n=1 Tax=Daphnia magna TaxID=35525 RepID=A0ABQ9ZTA4_9CRUS|nr:hypothetical protein OUZ56_031110 [Daphnia magna]